MNLRQVTTKGLDAIVDKDLFRQQCHIDGTWVDADSGKTIVVHDPATQGPIGTVPDAGERETRRAVMAADAAMHEWRKWSPNARANVLRRWFDLILASQEDLAVLMTLEQGKPLAEARSEVAYAASFIEWFSEEGKRVYGDTIPSPQADKRILVLKQPIGVCAGITPWNFPAAMVTRKCGPALAAGCTMVLKPASATPFSALALVELAVRAGIPKGVLNVVTGRAHVVGSELTSNHLIRKLSFTGSTEVGKILLAQCAASVKKTSMELGGNAPLIVFSDADLDAAVEGTIASKYRNAGQTCVCANRILVQDEVYDDFVAKLAARVATMKVGHGLDPEVTIGPLIDDAAVRKVEDHVEDAVKRGAHIVIGGKRSELGGSFYEPTVLVNVNGSMKVAREETFGPLAALFRFKDETEALQMANETEYGLASYFFGSDVAKVMRVAEALEFGIVGVNTGTISMAPAPFGGVKQSGIGREGSKYGIEDYLAVKYVCLGGMSPS